MKVSTAMRQGFAVTMKVREGWCKPFVPRRVTVPIDGARVLGACSAYIASQ